MRPQKWISANSCTVLLHTVKSSECKHLFLDSAVPMWAVGAIVVLVLLLVAAFIFCVFKKCFGKKKKPKKVRERKAGRRRKEKEGEGEAGDKARVSSLFLLGFRSPAWLSWCSGAVCLTGGRGEEDGWGRGERAGEAGQARVLVGLQLHWCPGRSWVEMEKHKCFILMHIDDFNLVSNACLLSPEAHSGHPTGSGPGCYGHGGDFWPLRQSLPVAGQKEEVRDQSAAEEPLSCFQRDVHLQGATSWLIVICVFNVHVLVSVCHCSRLTVLHFSNHNLLTKRLLFFWA